MSYCEFVTFPLVSWVRCGILKMIRIWHPSLINFFFQEFARRLYLTQGARELVAATQGPGPAPPEATLGTTGLSTTLGSTSEYTSTGDSYTYTYGDTSTAMSTSEKRVRIQTVSTLAF